MKNDEIKRPATVAEKREPQQAGETPPRWGWGEHSVWTPRMLTRLEQSEPTTKWFRLWDKVWAPRNLQAAFWAVWRNKGSPGVDHQTVKQFERHHQRELERLSQELQQKLYQAKPARRVWIPKPGSTEKRPLGIPPVRDRVVQGALKQVLEPIFERDFAEHSYGFRPGRGCRQAVARIEELLSQGYTWCVDADLKSYFDTIPHDRLMALVQERVADGSVCQLLHQYLKAGVMEELKHWEPTEQGTPQGAIVSPLLANLYLNPLDQKRVQEGQQMVRYADDFVVLCRSQQEAEQVLATLQGWVEAAGLRLHPSKTRIVNTETEGFDFLGWHFRGNKKWPRKKSQQKLQAKLRPLTRRTNGRSLSEIIAQANPILRGWHAYFHDSLPSGLYGPDGWLRRRLRAMLRKREKRPGFGKTKADHHRWPNKWFAQQGLYRLTHGSRCYG